MANRPDPSDPAVVTTPQPGDVRGRPEDAPRGAGDTVYGEPNGPRPPEIRRLPKDEIERRAAAAGGEADAAPVADAPDRSPEVDGYVGGGDQRSPGSERPEEHPKVVHDPTGRGGAR